MLERTERLRPETSDWSTRLSELTPNSAKIAYVQAATSDSCMKKAASQAGSCNRGTESRFGAEKGP